MCLMAFTPEEGFVFLLSNWVETDWAVDIVCCLQSRQPKYSLVFCHCLKASKKLLKFSSHHDRGFLFLFCQSLPLQIFHNICYAVWLERVNHI